MRVTFLLAVANGLGSSVLNAIDGLEYDNGQTLPMVRYSRDGKSLKFWLYRVDESVSLPVQSMAANGKWTIFLLTSVDSNWTHGTRAFRFFRRRILSAANENGGSYYLQGPWSIAEIKRRFPTWASNNIGSASPHVIFGDDGERVAQIDYAPTDQECASDTETTQDELEL